jgi:ATP-binding cassette subfamily B multidrug efflux pump
MNGRMIDTYTNMTTVKLFSHSGQEEDYAREDISAFAEILKKQYRMVTTFQILLVINNFWSIFALAGLCLFSWSQGQAAVGTLAASVGLFLRLTGSVDWVIWQINGFISDAATLKDSAHILTDKNSVDDVANASPLTVTAGKIDISHVEFAYQTGKPVLSGLTLSIEPGEKIGLVGRSGAGKTTMMNLLLRFYDLTSGTIQIDGQDIAKVRQDSLRANIGVVTQDTSLLHRSVRDNIGYGRPQATDADIIKAAQRAKAWDFIQGLEDQKGRKGLDAQTGERGVKLSGGQRQRIAIARVFLKDAPILILDEATSALDSEVEAAIQDNLFDLMQGKTVIAIAHRLSTLTEMDRLVVLDKGQIVETGSHNELVARGGLYADLWSRQSGGFIADDPVVDEAAAE